MDIAKKFLDAGKPAEALERLKGLLETVSRRDEWQVHELIAAAFHDLANAAGVAQASFNAADTDRFLRSQRTHFSNWIFALHYLPTLDAATLTNELAVYRSLYRDAEPLPQIERHPAEKISVGYIAPNFCDSSAARFYEALLTDYDREKFSVTAWSMSHEADAFTETVRANVDAYHDIAEESFFAAAQRIHGADVLIDLGGHTEGGQTLQVAAYRPARVQMTGIGYFDSTGLAAIDYFIGDGYLTADDATFAEKILPLKKAFAFRPNKRMVKARRARRKISRDRFTFGCLNNFVKLSDDYLAAVKKILDAAGNARIIFRDTTPLESRRLALMERLERFGIDADVRLGADDFFSDYDEIDLILDTFPYPGGLMTALAIYMGVPVLNLRGDLASRRTGADILHTAAADEFICTDADAYVSTAIDLATNPTRLAALTAKISVDKLTDTKTFVEDFYARLEAIACATSGA
ncbi:MAG: hypothetical protein SR2Q5_07050 [Quinella sp. 2Q5]|nr:hypothetical protein [Quinella sp. 2Q5]